MSERNPTGADSPGGSGLPSSVPPGIPAPARGNAPGTTYEGLSYAPRQRRAPAPSALPLGPSSPTSSRQGSVGRASQGPQGSSSSAATSPVFPHSPRSFQSHSSLFTSQQREAAAAAPPMHRTVSAGSTGSHHEARSSAPTSPIAAFPAVPPSPGLLAPARITEPHQSAAAVSAPDNVGGSGGGAGSSVSVRGKLRLQEMKGRAQQLGLTVDSFGWQLLLKLQAAPDSSDWGKAASLVGEGQVSRGRCSLLSSQKLTDAHCLILTVHAAAAATDDRRGRSEPDIHHYPIRPHPSACRAITAKPVDADFRKSSGDPLRTARRGGAV